VSQRPRAAHPRPPVCRSRRLARARSRGGRRAGVVANTRASNPRATCGHALLRVQGVRLPGLALAVTVARASPPSWSPWTSSSASPARLPLRPRMGPVERNASAPATWAGDLLPTTPRTSPGARLTRRDEPPPNSRLRGDGGTDRAEDAEVSRGAVGSACRADRGSMRRWRRNWASAAPESSPATASSRRRPLGGRFGRRPDGPGAPAACVAAAYLVAIRRLPRPAFGVCANEFLPGGRPRRVPYNGSAPLGSSRHAQRPAPAPVIDETMVDPFPAAAFGGFGSVSVGRTRNRRSWGTRSSVF